MRPAWSPPCRHSSAGARTSSPIAACRSWRRDSAVADRLVATAARGAGGRRVPHGSWSGRGRRPACGGGWRRRPGRAGPAMLDRLRRRGVRIVGRVGLGPASRRRRARERVRVIQALGALAAELEAGQPPRAALRRAGGEPSVWPVAHAAVRHGRRRRGRPRRRCPGARRAAPARRLLAGGCRHGSRAGGIGGTARGGGARRGGRQGRPRGAAGRSARDGAACSPCFRSSGSASA